MQCENIGHVLDIFMGRISEMRVKLIEECLQTRLLLLHSSLSVSRIKKK